MKNKTIAALIALLFGWLGFHHFYLGNAGRGILYLLFSWTMIPAIIAVLEAVCLLLTRQETFDKQYNLLYLAYARQQKL